MAPPLKKGAPAKKPAAPKPVAAPAAPANPHVGPWWLAIARKYIGVHEGNGIVNNPVVMKFFVEAAPKTRVTNDHATPWCAAYIGAVLHEAGLPHTGTLWALDYAQYGKRLAQPVVGAIGTKKRAGGGHVFFVVGFDKSSVFALGGNQDDKVCIKRIPRSEINSYSWPPGVPLPSSSDAGQQSADADDARED